MKRPTISKRPLSELGPPGLARRVVAEEPKKKPKPVVREKRTTEEPAEPKPKGGRYAANKAWREKNPEKYREAQKALMRKKRAKAKEGG